MRRRPSVSPRRISSRHPASAPTQLAAMSLDSVSGSASSENCPAHCCESVTLLDPTLYPARRHPMEKNPNRYRSTAGDGSAVVMPTTRRRASRV